MRQVHSSAALALAIILFCVPARPESVPSSQVSANDLARRVITNEPKFQDDHTNWMYRLEQAHGKHWCRTRIGTDSYRARTLSSQGGFQYWYLACFPDCTWHFGKA